MASEALTPKATALEEALQKAAVLNFGATWHGIAKRQMMAHGICRTIVEGLGITDTCECERYVSKCPQCIKRIEAGSTLLELAGEAPGDD